MSDIKYIRSLTNQGEELPDSKVIGILDSAALHKFMEIKIGQELGKLVEDCYYPRVADIHKELLYRTKTTDKELKKYAILKFKHPEWHNINHPSTILLVLITQFFLEKNNIAGALRSLSILALRFYTNEMHHRIRYCNKNYFRTAMEKLSHNHLFTIKKTIASAVLYLAKKTLDIYKESLINDDPENIIKMIHGLRSRIAQSARSFVQKYYEAAQEGTKTTLIPEEDIRPDIETPDQKIKIVSGKITRDITVYGKVNNEAVVEAQQLTKFNRKLAKTFSKALVDPKLTNELELSIYFLLKKLRNIDNTKIEYINAAKRLMSVKVSKQVVFYKNSIAKIHDQLIKKLGLTDKFEKLSVQSKHISKSFLSYYISLTSYYFLND